MELKLAGHRIDNEGLQFFDAKQEGPPTDKILAAEFGLAPVTLIGLIILNTKYSGCYINLYAKVSKHITLDLGDGSQILDQISSNLQTKSN